MKSRKSWLFYNSIEITPESLIGKEISLKKLLVALVLFMFSISLISCRPESRTGTN